MNRIVIDLEFTKVKDKEIRRICKDEIIQIGAVKLNDNNEVVSRFDSYVKPANTRISKRVESLTHISNEMVEDCVYFKEAFLDFINWIGEEDYKIYSWSQSDVAVLKSEIILENVQDERVERMFGSWIDAQALVSEEIGITQSLSLSTALKAINVDFEGQVHSALSDAENTAKLVTLLDDKTAFQKAMGPFKDLFAQKEDLTYSMGSLFEGICVSE